LTPPALSCTRPNADRKVAVTSAGWSFDPGPVPACSGMSSSDRRRSLGWPTLAPEQSESECDVCRMPFERLRQIGYHRRRIASRDEGNVADIAIRLSSWRNHSPPCSPRSTLSPTFASHPHTAAVCSVNNNNHAPCLTVPRPRQGPARSLANPTDQAVHHFNANSTQIRCNRPSP
jgi:hypothetical protein